MNKKIKYTDIPKLAHLLYVKRMPKKDIALVMGVTRQWLWRYIRKAKIRLLLDEEFDRIFHEVLKEKAVDGMVGDRRFFAEYVKNWIPKQESNHTGEIKLSLSDIQAAIKAAKEAKQ